MQADKIALDDLAQIMKDGFDGVDQRLDRVDQRLDRVDQRLDRVDQRLEQNDREHASMKNEMLDGFDKVLKSIEDIKTENVSNQAAHTRFSEGIENHEVRIGALEARAAEK